MAKISKDMIQTLFEAGTLIVREKVSAARLTALFQHFPNKEELIGILTEREAERHLKLLEEKYATLKGSELSVIVEELLREIARAMGSGKTGVKVILASTFAVERLEKLIHARRSLVSFVEQVLRESGKPSHGKAALIVAALGGIVQTLVFKKEADMTDEELIREGTKLVMAYINA